MKPQSFAITAGTCALLGLACSSPQTRVKVHEDEDAVVKMQPASRTVPSGEKRRLPSSDPLVVPQHEPLEGELAPPTNPDSDRAASERCPMSLAETEVIAALTADGISMVFRVAPESNGDTVAKLRKKVFGLAARYEQKRAPAYAAPTSSEITLPASTEIAYEEIPRGAQIVLTGADQADIDLIRVRINNDVELMDFQRRCPANLIYGGR